MNEEVCKKFQDVRKLFPDELDNSENYQFKTDERYKKYCINNCSNPLEQLNAGCLYIFNEFFGNSKLFKSVAKSNIHIVEYILIWLTYMLNLKPEGTISNLQFFYNLYINNSEKYNEDITDVMEYKNYKYLIDKNSYFLTMDKNIISKLYDALKSLCNMYNEFNETNPNCDKCLEKAKEFVETYEKLNEDPNNIDKISYRQVLCTLSNDYDNFKKKCKDIKCSNSSSFPTIEKNKIPVKCSEQIAQISEFASNLSIGNKLFIVLSIFGAIAFFLGISYKVNNKEFKNYFHYIYANFNKKIICFLTFYISIRYLDFGNDFKNKN
ncbi:hypothetical protein YYC_01151 [Plasmodium yoelii 17X]|uniref:Uncharacterized protein n=1 Tax=Plasmodium yoelii 17X TaxID=1323249 RepID=V7PR54_PLAYE|nr:hypothetical protein YYC_01151 [Plasmodium yoelii 17X]